MAVIVDKSVEYDAHTRHINVLNMTVKVEGQLRGAIRLKRFPRRTEESLCGLVSAF